MKEKFEYNRANIDFLNTKLPDYALECDKLLDEVQILNELEEQLRPSETSGPSGEPTFQKIKTNLNINQLVSIFFDLQHEIFVEGKPAIETDNAQIIDLVCRNFVDRDGKSISPDTVRTILLPSKPEKRPKGPKRINLDEIL